MYGINRCPRCGGHRLLRRSAREVLAVCAGCGLVTNEPEIAPGAGPAPPQMPVSTPPSSLELARSWNCPINAVGKGGWR